MSAEATGWVWRHSPWKGEHAKFLLHLAVADVVNDAHGNEFWMSQANLAEKSIPAWRNRRRSRRQGWLRI